MDGGLLSCHQLESRDEGLKHVVWGGGFFPWASMMEQVELGAVRPRTRVFGVEVGVEVRKCEEVLSLGAHHAGRDPGAELEDLAWRWMYRRKASEDQRPMSMMVNSGTPARYMAMAPPDRMAWVPMSSCKKPRTSGPMRLAAAWSWVTRKAAVMSRRLSFVRTVLTRDLVSQPG
jgi:hypothetical protein